MQGHTVKRRGGTQRVGYQCTYRSDYPGDESHPKTLFVAEDRVLPAVDHWLADLTSPECLDSTVAAILEADNLQSTEPPELRRARRQVHEGRKRLDQYLDALDAGMDPSLVTERTRTARVEIATASAVIDSYNASERRLMTAKEVHELLDSLGGLTALLADSGTAERQRVYRAAGVCLRYQRSAEGEKITASLRVGLFRVGGGTTTNPDWRLSPWSCP
jgi:hypothetical protein